MEQPVTEQPAAIIPTGTAPTPYEMPRSPKKTLRIVLIVVLLAAIAAGVACWFLLRQPENTSSLYLKTAWQQLERTDEPSSVSCMHFTSLGDLSTSVTQPSATVALIPRSGYAYLFAPSSGAGFDGLAIVFINDSGVPVSVLGYTDLIRTFEATNYAPYLDAANYAAYLYLDSHANAAPFTRDEHTGEWYAFSSRQIANMMKE